MSWGYLNQKKMPEEAARLLRKNGLLLISSLNWVRDADAITQRTGELLKKYGSERKHQRRREAGCIVLNGRKTNFDFDGHIFRCPNPANVLRRLPLNVPFELCSGSDGNWVMKYRE
jgi:hypothetical protein